MDRVKSALRERYSHLHPLLFFRAIERAQTDSDLFDMLDTMPDCPVTWDEVEKTWKHTDDLLQLSLIRKET